LMEREEWADAEVHALELLKHTPQTHVAYKSRRAMLDRIREALDGG